MLLLVFSVQSSVFLFSTSATFDEVQYFGIGKYLLKHRTWDVMGAILHPPLTYYMNSIPLLFVDEDPNLWKYEDTKRDLDFLGSPDIYRGQELLSLPANANDALLISSRLLTLLLGIMLGLYVYRFSDELFGGQAGLCALFLYSFCPNMLAFSGLIVPDMPLTVFTFMYVYYLWVLNRKDSVGTALKAGLCLGFALLTKFTALLLIPIGIILCLPLAYRNVRSALFRVACIHFLAAFLLCAGYMFDLGPFIQGNQYRMSQVHDGQWTFLMGAYSVHGWWYYYPLAFLMKTPIPVLVLLSLAIVLFVKYRSHRLVDLMYLLIPVACVVAVFSSSAYCLALRYILPIYPFIFVMCGSVAGYTARWKYVVGILACWNVVSVLSVAPHYLAYFNEAVGGPGNGYKYLVDGNLDWGQELKGLKRFMDRNGIDRISLSYFGGDSPLRYGISYDWLPSHHLYNPDPDKPAQFTQDQLVAISATNLQGLYFDNKDMYKWLLHHEPVAKIGYSIFVYDLKGDRTYR